MALQATALALLALGCPGPGWAVDSPQAAFPTHRDLTIAVISGVHGWISSTALNSNAQPHGLAHLAGPLRALKREYPGLLVLGLGDWLSGAPSPVDPAPALVAIASALGVATALPGERDLLRMAGLTGSGAKRFTLPWVASDALGLTATRAHVLLQSNGLSVGVIGLTRPGVVAAAQLGRAGVNIRPTQAAAAGALAAFDGKNPVDLTIAMVNGGRDSLEDQSTAFVDGLPVRYGLQEVTDGSIPGDLVIARVGNRRREGPREVSIDVVPVADAGPGLTVIHVSLLHASGRWRVGALSQTAVAPNPIPDPEVLAWAGDAWRGLGPWLAQPTRAVVSGYNRKADFMACAGELSHAAVVASVAPEGGANGTPLLTLMPQLWRFEPLRKRQRGQAIARAQLYRWMPYDDLILPASLTGRQIALLLEPYARYRSGWSVTPSLVLHPGGIDPFIPGRATQPEALSFAATGAALERQARYLVWMPVYHAYGAGGLARRALIQADQLGAPLDQPLRELVFQWMSSPAFTIPAPCAGFLALAPPR